MSELASSLYTSVQCSDINWSWTARYRLPELLPRDDVIAEIHRGVQAMRYSPTIPLEKIGEKGLSGVLIGPQGDEDATMVQDVIFATDPSKTYGVRNIWDGDLHALRIAQLNNWNEVEEDGTELTEEAYTGAIDYVRVIMGRNKDQYGGGAAFTLEEAYDMLPADTGFTMSSGYLFSDRPTWDTPYGEPAAIVQMPVSEYDQDAKGELFGLAWGLKYQHRFVIEAPWGAEVYEISSPPPQS